MSTVLWLVKALLSMGLPAIRRFAVNSGVQGGGAQLRDQMLRRSSVRS